MILRISLRISVYFYTLNKYLVWLHLKSSVKLSSKVYSVEKHCYKHLFYSKSGHHSLKQLIKMFIFLECGSLDVIFFLQASLHSSVIGLSTTSSLISFQRLAWITVLTVADSSVKSWCKQFILQGTNFLGCHAFLYMELNLAPTAKSTCPVDTYLRQQLIYSMVSLPCKGLQSSQ